MESKEEKNTNSKNQEIVFTVEFTEKLSDSPQRRAQTALSKPVEKQDDLETSIEYKEDEESRDSEGEEGEEAQTARGKKYPKRLREAKEKVDSDLKRIKSTYRISGSNQPVILNESKLVSTMTTTLSKGVELPGINASFQVSGLQPTKDLKMSMYARLPS